MDRLIVHQQKIKDFNDFKLQEWGMNQKTNLILYC